MLDISKIKAISIDLDDTLWPIWPTIERAERVLHDWLTGHAPMAAALFSSPTALREIRDYMAANRPDLKHDLSAIRRESIRLALYRAGEDPLMAERAFDVFHAERQRVELFDDVLPALDFLAQRFPIVSLSNGNADVQRVGLGQYFRAAITAREFGVGKPDPRSRRAGRAAARRAARGRRRLPGRDGRPERRHAGRLGQPLRPPLAPRRPAPCGADAPGGVV